MSITETLKKHFPDAVMISVDEAKNCAVWMYEGKEYSLSWDEGDLAERIEPHWYIGASEGPEDWGTYADSYEDVIENAAREDWSEHGRFIG